MAKHDKKTYNDIKTFDRKQTKDGGRPISPKQEVKIQQFVLYWWYPFDLLLNDATW